jgi:DNA-binding transcriptional regulator YhcF (GntR family)
MKPADITWGQRTRRVWAELSRAAIAGEALPSMRQLAKRCKLPSCSTAQRCVETLTAMGVVTVLARHEGVQQRAVTSALRLVQPYGWECYL